jgi:hypothetical protein
MIDCRLMLGATTSVWSPKPGPTLFNQGIVDHGHVVGVANEFNVGQKWVLIDGKKECYGGCIYTGGSERGEKRIELADYTPKKNIGMDLAFGRNVPARSAC